MSIQKDHPERQQGAHPSDSNQRTDLRPSPWSARPEAGRSPSATMKGRFTDHPGGPRAPAELSQYRAGRAGARAGKSEQTEAADGLPLMLNAFRAVLRDELSELSRQLTTQLPTAADEILTMDGAVQLLRVSSKTVRKWHFELNLPGSKVGAEWRFLRSEVLRWMRERHVR
jgi:excisionase family DNA binding protein